LGRPASACDVVTNVAAVTVATVAVLVTNVVGARKSVAAAKAAERRIDGRYDMDGSPMAYNK
jgi:hypothetical protein